MNLIVILTIIAAAALLTRPLGMAALAANVQRNRFPDQTTRAFHVAAATRIYKGGAVGLNATGYLVPYVPGTLFVGLAYEEKDNSAGSAGAVICRVEIGDFVLPIAGFAVGDVGKPVYASTDNDFTLSPLAAGLIGHAIGYEGAGLAVVRIEPMLKINGNLVSAICELDCEFNGGETAEVVLMPAILNKAGAPIVGTWGIISEVFAGATQDQGIITLQDTDGNSLNLTFTAADAGADALNDFIQEGGTNDTLIGATSGDAGAVVPAGKGVKAKVTQSTSGAGAAGKMKVVFMAILA